jgi:hypothetical protein
MRRTAGQALYGKIAIVPCPWFAGSALARWSNNQYAIFMQYVAQHHIIRSGVLVFLGD